MVFDESPRGASVAPLDLAESLPRTPRSRPIDREIPALEVTYVDAEDAPKPAEVKMTIYKSDESPRDHQKHKQKHKKSKSTDEGGKGKPKGGGKAKEKEREESTNEKTESIAAPVADSKPDEMKDNQAAEKEPTASTDAAMKPTARHLAIPAKPVLVPMASSANLLNIDKNRRLTLKVRHLTAYSLRTQLHCNTLCLVMLRKATLV